MQPVQANKAHRHRRSSRRPRAVARFSNARALLGGHDTGAEQRSLGAEPAKRAFIKRYSKCRQVTSRHLRQRVFSVVLGSLYMILLDPCTHICVFPAQTCVCSPHAHMCVPRTHTHTFVRSRIMRLDMSASGRKDPGTLLGPHEKNGAVLLQNAAPTPLGTHEHSRVRFRIRGPRDRV